MNHLGFIREVVKDFKPDIILYEHTNFVSLKGKDMTYLLKLLGAVEALDYSSIREIVKVPVDQVKRLKKKLLKGETKIAELEYKKGKG
jgi:hypothetical protein